MPERRIRALVIDFGGVLTTPLRDSFGAFCREEGVDLERIREALGAAYAQEDTGSLVSLVETGRIPVPEFERRLAAALSEEGRALEPAGLVQRMVAHIRTDEAMVGLVRRARRARIKTALLSNSWGLEYYPHELLAEIFDIVLISGEVGMRKPNLDIYEHAIAQLGLEPWECLFVDDVGGNVHAAERAGMVGYVHRTATQSAPDISALLGLGIPALGR